ncbi:glycopeptide [Ganoderma leucocontextum]|nr:glycopeptide [Ganoderma leucocontextum]
MFKLFVSALALVALAGSVAGATTEKHHITFTNHCGHGTPMLIQGPHVLSKGKPYTHRGPLISAIAYLQTGKCGFNGDHCLTLETTLKNPNCPGCGSSTDLTLIPPHKFHVKTSFKYHHGCHTQHATCTSQRCGTKNAFFKTDDYTAQRQCETNNVGLEIIFC